MRFWDLDPDGPPALVRLYNPLPEFRVTAKSTSLLIVDMEVGSVTPDVGMIQEAEASGIDMTYYRERLKLVVPNIARLQAGFRDAGLSIAFTVGKQTPGGHRLAGSPVRPLRSPRALEDRKPTARGVITELAPREGELIIEKNTPGPFGVTNADHALRMLGINTLVVTGIVTDQCVEATVRGAFDFGYQVALVEDACATVEKRLHDASLTVMADWFCRIYTTDEIIEQARSVAWQA